MPRTQQRYFGGVEMSELSDKHRNLIDVLTMSRDELLNKYIALDHVNDLNIASTERLMQKNKLLKSKLESLRKENKELKDKLKVAKEALSEIQEFGHYQDDDGSLCYYNIAREALEKIKD
jgi:hypothetical protein